MQTFRAAVATDPRGGITNRCTTKTGPDAAAPDPVPNSYRKRSGRLLLRAVLPRSLLLLIELMLTTYDRRSAQCGQACTGKARHHNQIARLGHVAARRLGSCSRRGRSGHRFGVILLLDLVIGVALTAVLALLLSVLSLALALVFLLRFRLLILVLLLFGLVALLLRARTLIGFGLLGSLVLGVASFCLPKTAWPPTWSRPLRLRSFPWKPDQSCPCSGSSRY